MALTLSGTSGISGAGIGTIGPSGANVTGVGTFTQVEIDDKIVHVGDTNTAIRFPSADRITAETSGTERVRISSDGHVTLASTDNARGLELNVGSNGGSLVFDRNGYITSNIRASDGGSNVGGGSGGGSRIILNKNYLEFKTWPYVTNVGDAVTYTTRARIDGDGLKFGSDTAAANGLDDYEEGTFTPALTNGYSSITYNSQYGFYTKIGRFVSYSIYLYVQGASGDNSELRINTPFTTANTTGMEEGGSIVYQLNFLSTSDDSKTNAYVFTGKNMSYLRLIKNNNGAAIFGNDTTLGTGGNNVYLLIKGFLTTTA